MDTNALIEARKKAEAAVADMPEGELRVEAFKLILNRLLSGSDATPNEKGTRSAAKRPRGRNKPTVDQSSDGVPRTAPGRILSLKSEGFFDEPRAIGEVRDELQTHGWRYDVTALSGTLMSLVQKRDLRRSKVEDGKKTTYKYFIP